MSFMPTRMSADVLAAGLNCSQEETRMAARGIQDIANASLIAKKTTVRMLKWGET